MKIYSSESDLMSELQKNNYKIIGIDGADGAGKSFLAKKIGAALNLPVLSLDRSLIKDQDTYVDNIKYHDLSEQAKNINGPFIIEGVCLLYALKKLPIKLSCLIYIKALNDRNEWVDEDELNSKLPIEELIESIEQRVNVVAKQIYGKELNITAFRKEIIQYHNREKPFEMADIVFERVKNLRAITQTDTPGS